MATSSSNDTFSAFVSRYGGSELVVPIAFLLSVVASAIHLGVIGPIEPLIYADVVPSLSTGNSLLVFFGALAVTYATSDTRAWEHYTMPEKIVVGAGLGGVALWEWSAMFYDMVQSWGQPAIAAIFALLVIVGVVVAR